MVSNASIDKTLHWEIGAPFTSNSGKICAALLKPAGEKEEEVIRNIAKEIENLGILGIKVEHNQINFSVKQFNKRFKEKYPEALIPIISAVMNIKNANRQERELAGVSANKADDIDKKVSRMQALGLVIIYDNKLYSAVFLSNDKIIRETPLDPQCVDLCLACFEKYFCKP